MKYKDWFYYSGTSGNLILKTKSTTDTPLWQHGDWAYYWLANGMLQQVKRPDGGFVEFKYDALGRRTAKIADGIINRYVWDGNLLLHEWSYNVIDRPKLVVQEKGQLVYDRKEVAENVTTWVYDNNSFTPHAKLVDNKQYSIIADYLGTPIEAYDETGSKIWYRELDCYGQVRKGDNAFVPFLYQGQYWDEETGLAYNRFRYYDVERGTFTSKDPIGLVGGKKLYGYVKDSNVWVDPFGLDETFFRTISKSDADVLEKTGRLPGTTETTISPTKVFSEGYDGVTYEFQVKDGTTDALAKVGVRDQSELVRSKYPDMPEGGRKWNRTSARFKAETLRTTGVQQINIGLGKGKGLETFNDNIVTFKKCT